MNTKEQKPVIIVDTREAEILRKLRDTPALIEEKQLDVGDFVLSERVCVERKRIEDFLQSIIDQRLFTQLENLANSYERPLLILEGNPELLFLERNIHENTIRGVLASIAIDYKIPIIWTQNSKETAAQLFWIANREQILEKKEPAIRGSKKAPTLKRHQEYLIAGLPGISSKRARKLLEHFKTPEKVFRATENQLLQVDGFGEKMVKKMKDILKEPYAEDG